MDDRDFFDKISIDWDDNEVMSTPEKVNLILDYFELKKGDKILDLGTGTGILLPYLASRVGEEGTIVAVDFSTGMLSLAMEKFKHLIPKPEFLNLDFEKENIPGDYDTIILYCVYPHLQNPIDTLKWLEKVNLKEGGKIFIAFPCGPEFINNIHKQKHSGSDRLVSSTILADQLRRNNINAEAIASTNEAYVIKISK